MLRSAGPVPGTSVLAALSRSERLRHLFAAAALCALVVEGAAVQVVAALSGRLDPDLVSTPAASGAEALAAVALIALLLALMIAAVLGWRWLRDIDAQMQAVEAGAEAVGIALDARPIPARRGWRATLDRLAGRVGPSDPGHWLDDSIEDSTTTVLVAAMLWTVGIALVTVAIPSILLADGRESARTGWLVLAVAGFVLAPAAVLAWWLVGDIDRHHHAIVQDRSPDVGLSRDARERRWPALAIVLLFAVAIPPQAALVAGADPNQGRRCWSDALECRWILVEADHDSGGRGPTMAVAYGVWRATEERIGTIVMIPGGPGSSGIVGWDSVWSGLDPRLTESFDIVTFDPRGVAGSDHRDCPIAAAAQDRALLDRSGPQALEMYATACLAEAGVAPAALDRYGGDQVAQDIDAIRHDLGVERFIVYGESYGTATAQRYAAAFPERVEVLILDGVIDLEQDTDDFWREASDAFESVLDDTFAWCQDDVACAEAMPDPARSWDRVMSRLADGPVATTDGDQRGGMRELVVDERSAVSVLGNALYGEFGRMLALRAIAAAARDDWIPLARMIGGPAIPESDGSSSDFAYSAAWCADRNASGPTLDPASYLQGIYDRGAGRRIWDVEWSGSPCVTWPVAARPAPEIHLPPDVPVIVLTSTGDPITPPTMGDRVADRLDVDHSVYRIDTVHGPHVTFGRGIPCPDDAVIDVLLGEVRPERTIRCHAVMVEPYVGVVRRSSDIDGLALRVLGIEDELFYHPDYAAWSGFGSITIGCRFGGRITISEGPLAASVDIDGCAVLEGEPVNANGSYNADGTFRLTGTFPRGEFRYSGTPDGAVRLEGSMDGSFVDESW